MAVHSLILEKFTSYTETPGIPGLREAIAEYLNERYSSDISWEEVIVGPGAKAALFLAIAAYVREGDEVLIIEPAYPAYSEIAKVFRAKPVFVSLRFENTNGFRLDIEALVEKITKRTKMIVINNPHNPTGTVLTGKEIDAIVDIARENKLLILADEIYDNFVYDGAFRSLLSYPDWRDWSLYVNGFSKTFSMTGWRLGYLVVDRRASQVLRKLAVNIWGCPTSFVQKAGARALRDHGIRKWVEKLVRRYREMRDLMYEGLQDLYGVEVWKSRGAFYLFPRIKRFLNTVGMGIEEFVEYLIDNYQLIVLPGSVFPDKAGEGYVRFSFSASREEIVEGVKRFREAVEELLSRAK